MNRYRGCRVRRCLMHLKAASSSFCSLFARAASKPSLLAPKFTRFSIQLHSFRSLSAATGAIASNMPSGAATPRSRSNLSGPMSLKWAQCQGLQLHVVVVDFEHGLTRCAFTTLLPYRALMLNTYCVCLLKPFFSVHLQRACSAHTQACIRPTPQHQGRSTRAASTIQVDLARSR